MPTTTGTTAAVNDTDEFPALGTPTAKEREKARKQAESMQEREQRQQRQNVPSKKQRPAGTSPMKEDKANESTYSMEEGGAENERGRSNSYDSIDAEVDRARRTLDKVLAEVEDIHQGGGSSANNNPRGREDAPMEGGGELKDPPEQAHPRFHSGSSVTSKGTRRSWRLQNQGEENTPGREEGTKGAGTGKNRRSSLRGKGQGKGRGQSTTPYTGGRGGKGGRGDKGRGAGKAMSFSSDTNFIQKKTPGGMEKNPDSSNKRGHDESNAPPVPDDHLHENSLPK